MFKEIEKLQKFQDELLRLLEQSIKLTRTYIKSSREKNGEWNHAKSERESK